MKKGICGMLCHSFNFVNMRFQIIFFRIKFCKKIYFHGKFVTDFLFLILLSRMFPWMNKLFYKNNFLPRLMKQERCRSWHCTFQSIYTLNTCYKNPLKECR